MPEIISCPDCDRKLRVPEDLLGKKVKCPGCGITFTATAGGGKAAPSPAKSSPKPSRPSEGIEETPRASKRRSTPPPEEEEEERPRRRRREEDEEEDDDHPRRGREEDEEQEGEGDDERAPSTSARDAWKKVRLGITLVITSIFVAIGGAIVMQLVFYLILSSGAGAFTINPRTGALTMGTGMIFFVVLNKLVNYSALGLDIAGHGLNMSVPPWRGTSLKGLAITTFSLYASTAGLMLLVDVVSLSTVGMVGMGSLGGSPFPIGGAAGAAPLLLAIGVMFLLCMLAGWFCFMFLLRGIALAFGKHGLAKTIVSYMITAVSIVAGGVLLSCIGVMVFGAAMFNMAASAGPGGPNPQAMGNAGIMGGMLALVFGCIAVLVALAMVVWYIVILFQVRGVIDSYLRRR